MSHPPIFSNPPSPSPTPPPPRRNGCLQAIAILAGIMLLLPGVCAIIFASFSPLTLTVSNLPSILQSIMFVLVNGAGGVALIWWATKRPR